MSRLPGVTPFPPEFAARYRARGYWEDVPQGQFYSEVFASHGERLALVNGEERMSFAQMKARVDRLALHLLDLGVSQLDRWVVQLPNVPEFVYLYFALQRLGAIPIMALAGHRWNEINAFFELSGAKGYAVSEKLGDFDSRQLIEQIRSAHPALETVLVAGTAVGGAISIHDLLSSEPGASHSRLESVEIDPEEPCIFQLSGGTTGVPKLIPRTHNDYVYNTKAAAAVNDVQPDDCLLVVLPIAHNFPLACPGISGFFWKGARVVLSETARVDDVLPIIERERVTHLELVPALLIRYVNAPSIGDFDLCSVRVINTGGQKLQPEVKRRAEAIFPNARVQEVFGMAEGLLMFVRLDDPDEVRFDTVGRPVCVDDEIILVDEEHEPVKDGEVGELLVRGPYTLRGYYGVPEYNARMFTPDGFYMSGDLMPPSVGELHRRGAEEGPDQSRRREDQRGGDREPDPVPSGRAQRGVRADARPCPGRADVRVRRPQASTKPDPRRAHGIPQRERAGQIQAAGTAGTCRRPSPFEVWQGGKERLDQPAG